jgi:phosphoglycerate dehydrogenase-like enzyme
VTTVSVPSSQALDLIRPLPPEVNVIVWDGLSEPPSDAARIEFFVGRVDASPPSRETLARLPALRVIQVLAAGVEHWVGVVPEGTTLCSGRGIHGTSTAEVAVGGMIAVLRGFPKFVLDQQRSSWSPISTKGLAGQRLLVVGAGDVGRKVAAAASALDAEPILVARTARVGVHGVTELPRLIPNADIVVVALPLTGATAHLVDASFLSAMPDQALLVNVGRGKVVDTYALLDELRARRLRAFLDVTDLEPLPADHPLWTAPNLFLTPHIGGGALGWETRAYGLVRDQVTRFIAGHPLINQVQVGY